jgi:hypothetical protein
MFPNFHLMSFLYIELHSFVAGDKATFLIKNFGTVKISRKTNPIILINIALSLKEFQSLVCANNSPSISGYRKPFISRVH